MRVLSRNTYNVRPQICIRHQARKATKMLRSCEASTRHKTTVAWRGIVLQKWDILKHCIMSPCVHMCVCAQQNE